MGYSPLLNCPGNWSVVACKAFVLEFTGVLAFLQQNYGGKLLLETP